MPDYPYRMQLAEDAAAVGSVARGALVSFYAATDTAGTALLELKDPSGNPLPNPLTTTTDGFVPALIAQVDEIRWEGGGFHGFLTSYEGLKAEATAAAAAADASAASAAGAAANATTAVQAALAEAVGDAEAAASSAAAAAALVGAPADTAIAAAVAGPETDTRAALNESYVSMLIAVGAGIDPTGAADSTPAVQALVDKTATFGAALAFPPGIYRLNSLNLGPLTRLVGLGGASTRFGANGIIKPLVQFKHQTSSVLPMVVMNGGGISIENIEMQANFSTAPLLHVENGFESVLRNVRLMSVVGTALHVKRANNTKWYDVMVDNCGSPTAAAVVIKSPTSAEGNETNTLDVYNLTIERCKNVALDIAYGGTRADGFYAEFLRFTNLHVESANDNGGVANVDSLIRIGNVRNMTWVNPFVYGGGGYLVEHASNNTQTAKLKEGVTLIGGALLGQEDNTSSHLVHLVTGDDFAMVGVRAGRFNVSAVKVEATYGPKVAIDRTSSLDGSTNAWLTDSRAGYVVPQANKSIGGTGTTGTPGGSVTTLSAAGAVRNVLDDGAGAASVAGILTLLGGTRWINRTVTTTQTLTLADIGVVSTATNPITLTLSASSNTFTYIKNLGTKVLIVAAPASGTAPAIDGQPSIALMPGEAVLLNGRSSSVGTWAVIARGAEQAAAGVPAIAGGANLGGAAPAPTLDAGSNDNRGRIQIGTGTSPAAGALLTVTFGTPFQAVPFVQVSTAAQNGTGPFVKDVTTTGFVLGFLAAPVASQPVGTYALSYRVTA